MTLAELKYGIECSNDRENGLRQLESFVRNINVLPFEVAIDTFSKEKARLRKSGTPVDDFDLLIGSTARALNMILVTDNQRHFSRIEGLKVENWVNANAPVYNLAGGARKQQFQNLVCMY